MVNKLQSHHYKWSELEEACWGKGIGRLSWCRCSFCQEKKSAFVGMAYFLWGSDIFYNEICSGAFAKVQVLPNITSPRCICDHFMGLFSFKVL